MTIERSKEIEYIRSEIVGPSRKIIECDDKVTFDSQNRFLYPSHLPGQGFPVFWRNNDKVNWQEIIHVGNENPLNSYGAGFLSPNGLKQSDFIDKDSELNKADIDESYRTEEQEILFTAVQDDLEIESPTNNIDDTTDYMPPSDVDDDFEVTSPDIFRPSSMGITFCINGNDGEIVIELPSSKLFFWQNENDDPFPVNGRYEECEKIILVNNEQKFLTAWRRSPVIENILSQKIKISDLQSGKKNSYNLLLLEGSALSLSFEIFPRIINSQWIITVVLRNTSNNSNINTNKDRIIKTLFQSYFEVRVEGNCFVTYPESTRPFKDYDDDEKSLALLYQDAATWAIGHGCSAGWDANLGETPSHIYTDSMPAVELPSMTPDIKDDLGNPVTLSMRELSDLPSYNEKHPTWISLQELITLYGKWIHNQINKIELINPIYKDVANKHMDSCLKCNDRLKLGLDILKHDSNALSAFKLANKSMLLQQISSKNLKRRPLIWNGDWVEPAECLQNDCITPQDIYLKKSERAIGHWRAFQIAFLLMSIDGLINDKSSDDRDVVDLIWFPTGGGKTEAYLAVASFYMFHQRLLMNNNPIEGELRRDGTNVFMRYTLRMLTTQQFQRAASLICAMEFIRINEPHQRLGAVRFSLGLWIGGDGSPNKCDIAQQRINEFKRGDIKGNPLVLTECPWCKSEIGRIDIDPRKKNTSNKKKWSEICTAGIGTINKNEPILKCSDISCHFGGEHQTLPIEVIDERIYENPPSMIIGTADKFAILAYRPKAGAIFGRKHSDNGNVTINARPPGLIIQDEFHLISGPLGTIYGVYEGIIEELCTYENVKPKVIASTATIRGAKEQVKSIYARQEVQLFPSPGLLMKDSFFGRYATSNETNELLPGRLYLGIHAYGYGSFLTTQVRTFTAALFRPYFFDNDNKDPWWTLLTFYNSLRELGGARTLFDSDIAARLKNYFYKYGFEKTKYRYLHKIEELTSRNGQAELVHIMDRLSTEWDKKDAVDVCLASNIIEVGVDIDRLSLMAIIGQPKSTAQYIQVTGRVGRKWWERPGLIISMYNTAKSRDRSHFEQFHSYHRRLYEQVEPTTATPFSIQALDRAMISALIMWARQFYDSSTPSGGYLEEYRKHLETGYKILHDRCLLIVQDRNEKVRVSKEMSKLYDRFLAKWEKNPLAWEQYPQKNDGEYLMLWPGQFATETQKRKGETILSSMRNVDSSGYLQITDYYTLEGQ